MKKKYKNGLFIVGGIAGIYLLSNINTEEIQNYFGGLGWGNRPLSATKYDDLDFKSEEVADVARSSVQGYPSGKKADMDSLNTLIKKSASSSSNYQGTRALNMASTIRIAYPQVVKSETEKLTKNVFTKKYQTSKKTTSAKQSSAYNVQSPYVKFSNLRSTIQNPNKIEKKTEAKKKGNVFVGPLKK